MVLCLRMTALTLAVDGPFQPTGLEGSELGTHRGAGTIGVPGGALVREPIEVTWIVGLGTSGAAVLEPVDEESGKLPWLPPGLPAWPPLRWKGGRVMAAGALDWEGERGGEEASGDDGADVRV